MDVRHESYKEGLLNHLIKVINNYINDYTDTLVSDNLTREQIANICKLIYEYLDMEVDIITILSKQNLLSIDVVLFPPIIDPEAGKILNDMDFKNLINDIRLIIQLHDPLATRNSLFQKNIYDALRDYLIKKN